MMHPLVLAAMAPKNKPLSVNAGFNLSKISSGASACANMGSAGSPASSVSGGVSPYTYLWELVGSPAQQGPYVCSDVNSLNPHWSASIVCDGDSPSIETWRLTVTDDIGQIASDTITVNFVWTNTS